MPQVPLTKVGRIIILEKGLLIQQAFSMNEKEAADRIAKFYVNGEELSISEVNLLDIDENFRKKVNASICDLRREHLLKKKEMRAL